MRERFYSGLIRNLSAGTRLGLFLPVRWTHFRASPGQFALLTGFNLLVWTLSSTLHATGDTFNPAGVAAYLAQISLLLVACLAIASVYGNAALVLLLAVALSAADLVFELASVAFLGAGAGPRVHLLGWIGFLAWAWIVAMRAVVVCMGFRWPQTAASAGVVSALMGFSLLALPRAELWSPSSVGNSTSPELAREEVFHAQGELIERRLGAIEAGTAGRTELYFVGFAPDGSQNVFLREMRSVKQLIDDRHATAPRSIALVNNPATLGEYPIATATNLRRALNQVAARMNPDEDVLFLYITAHGGPRFELSAHAPPLELAPVNPTLLARSLHDAGIKWRVLVVSACYAGGFIEPLKDDNSLIVTASAADRQSFGCESGNDWTYFGEAYFKDALGKTDSFIDAFPLAVQSVALRETAEKLAPASNPQMFVGRAIAEKLRQLPVASMHPGG